MSKESGWSPEFTRQVKRDLNIYKIKDSLPQINLKNISRFGLGFGAGFGIGFGSTIAVDKALAESQKSSEVTQVDSDVVNIINHLHSFDSLNGNSGAIWTRYSCDNPQDANHYMIGQDVVVYGEGFNPQESFDVIDTGQPGGASCDPDIEVARKSITTNGEGNFCVDLYTVQSDDCGEYTVDTSHVGGSKNDNYRVEEAQPTNTPRPTNTQYPTETVVSPTITQTQRVSETATKTSTSSWTATVTSTATRFLETLTATATKTVTLIKASLTPTAIVTETKTPVKTPSPCAPCPTCPSVITGTPEEECNPCEELRRSANAQETLAAALDKKVGPEQTMAAAQSTLAAVESTRIINEQITQAKDISIPNNLISNLPFPQTANKESLKSELNPLENSMLEGAAIGLVTGFTAGGLTVGLKKEEERKKKWG